MLLREGDDALEEREVDDLVVGLWGKEKIITLGLGQIVFIARSTRSMKSPSPEVSEIDLTSAPAMITE